MSRTFRCKNYELENQSSWSNHGRKTAGYYTVMEGGWWSWNASPVSFRAPTKEEFTGQYWRNHGESKSANSRSPGKSYRKMRMRENRAINRQEIIRFLKNEEYEPMCEANPRNCWWDWS